MNLSPTELERLTIFTAAEFARRNLRMGIPLSHPEAIAFITDEAMLLARLDLPYSQIRDRASRMLTTAEVMPGVASMVTLIMVELPMAEGTKLLAIYDPIGPAEGELEKTGDVRPGEILVGSEAIEVLRGLTARELEVVNRGDRDVQVRSQTHFFEVNKALSFDREAAWGMKLNVVSGAGVRFEPGLPRIVELVPIAGDRIVRGQAGLVDGALDDRALKARAFKRARERGYLLDPGKADA